MISSCCSDTCNLQTLAGQLQQDTPLGLQEVQAAAQSVLGARPILTCTHSRGTSYLDAVCPSCRCLALLVEVAGRLCRLRQSSIQLAVVPSQQAAAAMSSWLKAGLSCVHPRTTGQQQGVRRCTPAQTTACSWWTAGRPQRSAGHGPWWYPACPICARLWTWRMPIASCSSMEGAIPRAAHTHAFSVSPRQQQLPMMAASAQGCGTSWRHLCSLGTASDVLAPMHVVESFGSYSEHGTCSLLREDAIVAVSHTAAVLCCQSGLDLWFPYFKLGHWLRTCQGSCSACL